MPQSLMQPSRHTASSPGMKPNAAKDKAMVGKVLHGCIYPSVTPNAVFLTPTMTQRGSSCNSTSLKDCGYSLIKKEWFENLPIGI